MPIKKLVERHSFSGVKLKRVKQKNNSFTYGVKLRWNCINFTRETDGVKL